MSRFGLLRSMVAIICVIGFLQTGGAAFALPDFPYDTWYELVVPPVDTAERPAIHIERDGSVGFMSWCNIGAGITATLTSNTISFHRTRVITTLVQCKDSIMASEKHFMSSLSGTYSWRVVGKILILDSGRGEMRFQPRG